MIAADYRHRRERDQEPDMPFCDFLNNFFDWLQAAVNFLYSVTGLTPPDFNTTIGSILGCNIV